MLRIKRRMYYDLNTNCNEYMNVLLRKRFYELLWMLVLRC